MSGRDSYELSASYIDGLVHAVKKGGFFESVLANMADPYRSAYLVPARRPWWDARFAENLAAAVLSAYGEWALEQVGHDVVVEALGQKLQPLLEAALAGGRGPEALFERLEQFAAVAVRPIQTRWTQHSPTSGRLELIYPRELRRETQVLWRGAIRYAFDVSRRPGKIEEERQGPPGHLTYELRWT